MLPAILVVILGVALGLFFLGRKSRDEDVRSLREASRTLGANLDTMRNELNATKKLVTEMVGHIKQAKAINESLHAFGVEQIKNIRSDGAVLPSLVRWADVMREHFDDLRDAHARQNYASAPMANERVSEARARARVSERERDELFNRLELYEAQAPWLVDYADCTVEEILSGLRLEEELATSGKQDRDPVAVLLSGGEWSSLNAPSRSQLALDRFLDRSRARSAWAAGIEYERYVGYRYEQDGWQVEYQGAIRGKSDLGIDLVCIKGCVVHAVQCKRLSPEKGLPVRENTIGQIYGSAQFLAFERELTLGSVTPIVVTTFELSPEARLFATTLGVRVRENEPLQSYPRIKCNISRKDGLRIYHLPFDQQYDRTIIAPDTGECYVHTVAEAEAAGFRRAFRWRG